MHEKPGRGPRGYEESDFRARPAVYFAIALLVAVGFAILLAGWFYSSLEADFQAGDSPPSPLAATDQTPPDPRLQVYPRQELDAAREKDRERLHEYRWIDRSQGTVQIPIERAIDLLLERGLPETAASGPNPAPGSR